MPQKAPTAKKPPAPAPSPKAADKPAAAAQHRPAIKPARMPKGSSLPMNARESVPLTSRTATLDDPLTTSLLAEIARRPATADVLPEQIAEVMAIARGDRDPDDST